MKIRVGYDIGFEMSSYVGIYTHILRILKIYGFYSGVRSANFNLKFSKIRMENYS